MASYRDPGVYIQEKLLPSAVSINDAPKVLCIVAPGSPYIRVDNEPLIKDLILGEALSDGQVAGGKTTYLLKHRSDGRASNIRVYRNGTELTQNAWELLSPMLSTEIAAPVDMSAKNMFAISLDGKPWLTVSVEVDDGALDSSASMVGSVAYVTLHDADAEAMGSADIAKAINLALGAAGVIGYGVNYGSVASVSDTFLNVASPMTGPVADVRVMETYVKSAVADIWGTNKIAPTSIEVAHPDGDIVVDYVAAEYLDVAAPADKLAATTTVDKLLQVGFFPSVTSFSEDDYSLTQDSDGAYVVWHPSPAVQLDGVLQAGTVDLTDAGTLVLAMDFKPSISVNILTGPDAALGGVPVASDSAALLSEIANNINATLAAARHYGPRYRSVAAVVGDRLVLTSPTSGQASSAGVYAGLAAAKLFGVSDGWLESRGSGRVPAAGTTYYVTYSAERPDSLYNVAHRALNRDQALGFTGPVDVDNPLAIAVDIAYDNGVEQVQLIQVTAANGTPSLAEYKDGLVAAEGVSAITDVVTLSTDTQVGLELNRHVEDMSNNIEGNYRRAWIGPQRDIDIGDSDTPGSHVALATRTYQVHPSSAARGRVNVVGPTNVSRTIRTPSGAMVKVPLNGAYVAVAQAAQFCSLPTSESALGRQLYGFDTDDFQTYRNAERRLLAGSGVSIARLDNGRILTHDPTTTERSGGGRIDFEDPAQLAQRDAVTRAVTQVLTSNLLGVTPHDIDDFLSDIRSLVGATIAGMISNGDIAPFRDANGASREIDYNTDIVAIRDPLNPKNFKFKYYFNLKYVARTFSGEFSVDSAGVLTA